MRLHHSNWERHKPKRPEVVPYHDDIASVLGAPNVVVESGGRRHYYRRGIGREIYENLYLRVIVGIGDDTIRTVYFCKSVDRDGLVVHVLQRR